MRKRRRSKPLGKSAPTASRFTLAAYCNAAGAAREKELQAVIAAARLARSLGLEVHGGHGLNYQNVSPIAHIPEIVELNIGHSIIARAVIAGIAQAVREMKEILDRVRAS